MSAEVWVYFGIATVALFTFLGTRVAAKSSEKVAAHSVENDAYTSALNIWTTLIDRLTADVLRLNVELVDARDEMKSARLEIRNLIEINTILNHREIELDDRVQVLEATCIKLGISPPEKNTPPREV